MVTAKIRRAITDGMKITFASSSVAEQIRLLKLMDPDNYYPWGTKKISHSSSVLVVLFNNGIIERKQSTVPRGNGKYANWIYKLTPLGEQLAAIAKTLVR